MNMIIKTYRITYENDISQTKNLIKHSDFLNVIKPTEKLIYELERKNKFKPTAETKQLGKDLKNRFSDNWFTDGSPLFNAISSGVLETPFGNYKCYFKEL
jgi:hypothetical protein